LLKMLRAVKDENRHLAITPDGPKGPRKKGRAKRCRRARFNWRTTILVNMKQTSCITIQYDSLTLQKSSGGATLVAQKLQQSATEVAPPLRAEQLPTRLHHEIEHIHPFRFSRAVQL